MFPKLLFQKIAFNKKKIIKFKALFEFFLRLNTLQPENLLTEKYIIIKPIQLNILLRYG